MRSKRSPQRRAKAFSRARPGNRSLDDGLLVTQGDARLLLGGPIAGEIRVAVTEDVEAFRERAGYAPGLAIVIVGRDAPSTVYLQQIMRSCEKVGIERWLVELEGEA